VSRFFGATTSSKGTSTSSSNSMKSPPTSKRPVAKKEDSDDDDDTPILPTAIRKREGNNKRRAIQDDDDDTPILPTAIRKRTGNNKRRAIQDDDDDDDSDAVVIKPVVTKPSSQQTSTAQTDFASDEEEAVALAWAMGESQKAAAKQGRSITESPSSQQQEEEEDVVNMLEDSSDDDDEDEGDEQDEYVDKDAQAAGSVLATANELSAQVLQTMMRWAAARSRSSEKDDGDAVPLGMIVDGALALSSMDEAAAPASDDHNWISQELMRKICPNVTLANYQLIGVNWMALLHGMKCEVKGRKSHTNVNGILADEMGLG
jgi:SNF2 family DNA or RNA helicase